METLQYIKQIEQQQKKQEGIYHQAAVKCQLSDSAMWVLYVVSEEEGCTQQYICNQGFLAKQTINTTVTKLVNAGYVELKAISGMRHQKQIFITEKGKRLVENTVEKLKKAEVCAFGKFTEEELQQYLDMTTRLTDYLQEEIDKF